MMIESLESQGRMSGLTLKTCDRLMSYRNPGNFFYSSSTTLSLSRLVTRLHYYYSFVPFKVAHSASSMAKGRKGGAMPAASGFQILHRPLL